MATAASTLGILAVSGLLGILVDWKAPGIGRYTSDWLMRARGPLPPPDDIAIVAIDERAISRFGRFPWPRSVLARTVEAISLCQPKAIAIDVLFPEPTEPDEDAVLERAVSHAANVALAAQLAETRAGGVAEWLEPFPALAEVSAGIGHVNVLTESDGAARELFVRMSDDRGRTRLALPLEAVRIADQIPAAGVLDTGRALVIGNRTIPLEFATAAPIVRPVQGSTDVLRAGRVAIDYIGPANSFASKTFSVADVLDGRTPPGALANRYVLVGSTAASLGERFSSPFLHQDGAGGDQHGTPTPGVEVLANALNTVLRGRFYTHLSDSQVFLLSALVALLTLAVLRSAEGRRTLFRQVAGLAGVATVILACSYVAFTRWLLVPPLAPGLVSFASAGVLGLLRQSLVTSSRLDRAIANLAPAGDLLMADSTPQEGVAAIARLAGAPAVALFASREAGRHEFACGHGAPVLAALRSQGAVKLPDAAAGARAFFALPETGWQDCALHLEALSSGALLLAFEAGRTPSSDVLHTAAAIAEDCLARCAVFAGASAGAFGLPRGLEDKARTVALLNARLMDRTQFLDLALRSVEDGLLILSSDGAIRFANPSAASILESTASALTGRNLFERLADCTRGGVWNTSEVLGRLLLDRSAVQQEVVLRGTRPQHYTLRIAPVTTENGPVLGLVASLSDITRQKELHQTQKDVIALVSHEMRTPLAAIQGMSELLAAYDLPVGRRRELTEAINDEAKRLTRMIASYLDIARLESGAVTLHRTPLRFDQLVDRTLFSLEPLAAARDIRIERRYAADLPPMVADADLLSRAADNLISNAIKYSAPGTVVSVRLDAKIPGTTSLEVADQGYGIGEEHLARIFEKFYRVPRPQDAGVPGTGLGLALVREIAELHGGSITVTSRPGTGSTFTLTIPSNPEEERAR